MPESIGINSPSNEVLEHFGAQVLTSLGGRFNKHWHVNVKNERFVLRQWSPLHKKDDIDYEVRLLRNVAALGWPVAPVVEGPIELGGHMWCLFPYLPGDLLTTDDPIAEQRARGRLLAQFHADLVKLRGFGQRGGWRRCENIVCDPALDRLLDEHDRRRPEEVRILRWHLERARERLAGLKLQDRPGMIVHGDFTPWNLRFQDGRLTGILDFELAHWDYRVGDFALSWRGKYDEVVYGYHEVSALEPEEWELLTPLWWAGLIELACKQLAEGIKERADGDGWTIRKLLERSPLMGRDAKPFR
ncbi:phosphotransferase [Paenibacillus humicola]|uniref:phosphotransferase n=1 Tax=Paenibacillus humicola TaxID=3110540 RepID=UPI00237C1DD3|nr:phosphotransferase [Paenibacillus humicola]